MGHSPAAMGMNADDVGNGMCGMAWRIQEREIEEARARGGDARVCAARQW